MDAETRKTLEALADLSVRAEDVDDGLMGAGYHLTNAAAIRAALAEIDALTEQVRAAFLEGAKWWEFRSRHATMWQSDQNDAGAEALRRYPRAPTPAGVAGAVSRESAVSARDTGWDAGGQRTVGQFVLHAIQFDGEFVRARVWFDHGDTLVQAAPTTKHPTPDAAKRAAEDALRTLCRDTLACLGDAPPPA